MDLNRFLLIDKPAGITSFGVVARIRRQLTEQAKQANWPGKRLKVGHCGTLDPFATGLLIVLTGKKTRKAEKYSKLDKVYEATIKLGELSTTGDPEGDIKPYDREVLAPTETEVNRVLTSFVGEIVQTPPIYSAIKINGRRAYQLARRGEKPDIPPRKVTIYDIEQIFYSYPVLKIRTHVSSGTYIRTLAEDIGKKLGTGAYTTELRRTKIGEYDVRDAVKLAQ